MMPVSCSEHSSSAPFHPSAAASGLAAALEELYQTYNHRSYVEPDPIQFLYDYADPVDREVAGVVAASLSYGRVAQILKSTAWVLDRVGESPAAFLRNVRASSLRERFRGFRHRWSTDTELTELLAGLKRVLQKHESLGACCARAANPEDDNVLPVIAYLAETLGSSASARNSLLPHPVLGSACKRWHMLLRWMVRCDEVDPGGWDFVRPDQLMVPLDAHMHRVARDLGLTRRRQGNARTVAEITNGFRALAPKDPVRYDFALTRLGIRADADYDAFLKSCRP
jgi:uncharacterized protein (TIGR02757 family)